MDIVSDNHDQPMQVSFSHWSVIRISGHNKPRHTHILVMKRIVGVHWMLLSYAFLFFVALANPSSRKTRSWIWYPVGPQDDKAVHLDHCPFRVQLVSCWHRASGRQEMFGKCCSASKISAQKIFQDLVTLTMKLFGIVYQRTMFEDHYLIARVAGNWINFKPTRSICPIPSSSPRHLRHQE